MPQPDPQKMEQFMGRMVGELGAAMGAALVVVGDRLGLYRAMAGGNWMTPKEVADAAQVNERYVREWLSAQAAGQLSEYDPETGRFRLNPEQAMAFGVPDSPVAMTGAFCIIASMFQDADKITGDFRKGDGVGWHEHHPMLFEGTDRFFRPAYQRHLVSEWLPALDGMVERLQAGAKVADIGCGLGSSTRLMAKAFPQSKFYGFDYHDASIQQARKAAQEEGLGDRVQFSVAKAQDFPAGEFDLAATFDCLHDMGDPVSAASQILRALKKDGIWMIVEPYANDRLEDNLNPVGRLFYAASTMICTPASMAQEGQACLGAQAGEAKIGKVVTDAGFTRFRRATETPFNLIYEARP